EKHIIAQNYEHEIIVEGDKPFRTTDSSCSYEIHPFVLRVTTKLSFSGTADSGSTTTLTDSALTESDDFWNGYQLKITSGDNIGLERIITDFNATTDTLSFDALPYPISAGDHYDLFLNPESQIVISTGVANTDTKSKAGISPKVDAVNKEGAGGTIESVTGGYRGYDGFNEDAFIKKIIKGSILPSALSQNPTAGLNLTQDYLGYYDGTSPYSTSGWKVYIKNDGKFYFGGDASNYIQWDGSTLSISGSVYVQGGDAFSKTSDTLDDIQDGVSYVKTSPSERDGAARAYNALNPSSRYKQWLVSTELASGSNPSPGVVIDSGGIRGYNSSSVRTFEIDATTGDAYFRGTLGACTLEAGNLLTVDSSSYSNVFNVYANGIDALISNNKTNGKIFLDVTSGGRIAFSVGGSIKAYFDDGGVIHLPDNGLDIGSGSRISSIIHQLDYPNTNDVNLQIYVTNVGTYTYSTGLVFYQPRDSNGYIGPYSSSGNNLGSSTNKFGDFYLSGKIAHDSTHYLETASRDYSTHDALGFNHVGDIFPEGTGIWDLGNSSNRFHTIYLTTNPDVSSDESLKRDIKPISYGLNEILKLNPIKFKFKDGKKKDRNQIGLLAKEVKKVIPEIATKTSYQPTSLIPILINAIKELNAKVEALETKLN
ncbi:MAG: tail fiber domain-containing protein, partial [Candidatus Hodarchaeales archaeon]